MHSCSCPGCRNTRKKELGTGKIKNKQTLQYQICNLMYKLDYSYLKWEKQCSLSNFVFPHFQFQLDQPGRRFVIVELVDRSGLVWFCRKNILPGQTLIAVTMDNGKGEVENTLLLAHDIFSPTNGDESFNWKLRHFDGRNVDPGEIFPEVIISQNIVRRPVSSLTITEPLRVETSEGSESSQRAPKLVWCPRKCFSWTRSKFTDLFLHAKI
jgi:hypothetical protein